MDRVVVGVDRPDDARARAQIFERLLVDILIWRDDLDGKVGGDGVEFAEISMGNPHAVIEHPDPDAVVAALGPAIETDARFPERTNVEFVRAEGPSELTMRVWERGVGETLACGTGACAAAVAGVRLGGLRSPVTVHLAGGDLEIAVADDLEVTMTGPAERVYRGELSGDLVRALEEL